MKWWRTRSQRQARKLVKEFFNGNEKKTEEWFETPNPSLGGISPKLMIAMGKEEKLLKFIKAQLMGDIP